MKQSRPSVSARRSAALHGVLVLILPAGFVACAGSAPRPDIPTVSAPLARPVDQEQRNRQFQHAEALYLSGRLREAAASFDELTRAYPGDERVWLKYGNTLTKQGSYDGAASAFETAARLDPAQGGALLNLALVRLAQAREALDAAVDRLSGGSSEHAQAEALQRQIASWLGAPERTAPTH